MWLLEFETLVSRASWLFIDDFADENYHSKKEIVNTDKMEMNQLVVGDAGVLLIKSEWDND